MENVLTKAGKLFDTLQVEAREAEVRNEAIASKEEALTLIEDLQNKRAGELAAGEKKFKKITDVVAEQHKANDMKSEALKLQAANETAQAEIADMKKQADLKLQEADGILDEVNGTRERLMAEVKKVEIRKKKLKAEIMTELGIQG